MIPSRKLYILQLPGKIINFMFYMLYSLLLLPFPIFSFINMLYLFLEQFIIIDCATCGCSSKHYDRKFNPSNKFNYSHVQNRLF